MSIDTRDAYESGYMDAVENCKRRLADECDQRQKNPQIYLSWALGQLNDELEDAKREWSR